MTVSITNVKLAGGNAAAGTAGSIRGEFGTPGPLPTYLSAFARGGAYVPAGQGDAGYGTPAASGPFYMGRFRNQTKEFVFNDTIASSLTTSYNLFVKALNAGWNGSIPLNASVTVNPSVYVTSNSTSTPAFLATGSYPSGSKLNIINNGAIIGRGGNGGAGGASSGSLVSNGSPGSQGGTALQIQLPTTIINNNLLGGGAGGGGGGGAAYDSFSGSKTSSGSSGGGGGGGGQALGAGGAGGGAASTGYNRPGAVGTGAGFSPGAGGAGGSSVYTDAKTGTQGARAGAGGAGGTPGLAGAPGALAPTYETRSSPGNGGQPGLAIVGTSFLVSYSGNALAGIGATSP